MIFLRHELFTYCIEKLYEKTEIICKHDFFYFLFCYMRPFYLNVSLYRVIPILSRECEIWGGDNII